MAALPWKTLLPDLVRTSMAAPEKLPYSALDPSATIRTSSTAS